MFGNHTGLSRNEDATLALNSEYLVFLDQHVLVQSSLRHAPSRASNTAAWGLRGRRSLVLAEEIAKLGQKPVPPQLKTGVPFLVGQVRIVKCHIKIYEYRCLPGTDRAGRNGRVFGYWNGISFIPQLQEALV